MIACFLGNISAKYYKNPSVLSRVMAKNVGDVFLRHSVHCKSNVCYTIRIGLWTESWFLVFQLETIFFQFSWFKSYLLILKSISLLHLFGSYILGLWHWRWKSKTINNQEMNCNVKCRIFRISVSQLCATSKPGCLR